MAAKADLHLRQSIRALRLIIADLHGGPAERCREALADAELAARRATKRLAAVALQAELESIAIAIEQRKEMALLDELERLARAIVKSLSHGSGTAHDL